MRAKILEIIPNRPAVTKFTFADAQSNEIVKEAERLTWIDSDALVKCLNGILFKNGIPKERFFRIFRGNNIFDNFGIINRDGAGKEVYSCLYLLRNTSESPQCDIIINGHEKPKRRGRETSKLYVPALWSESIIDLVNKGVILLMRSNTGIIGVSHDLKEMIVNQISPENWMVIRK